ncbi:MAG TPA: helicase-related protein, partial [Planctomycetota bacterium]|nr:helicase-related protein [Planctomycetota bacterium]
NDIEKNLREPLKGIYETAGAMGIIAPEIRVLVRTGDTLAADRQAMIKRPPHILVTTPESLYILLTAARSREFLKGVRTVIVDEIHALAKDKRGAHLALSLERLDALVARSPLPSGERADVSRASGERGVRGDPLTIENAQPLTRHSASLRVRPLPGGERGTLPQRIGLSATQRPVERVAEFLVGARRRPLTPPAPTRVEETTEPDCQIVTLGHLRKIELSLEIPSSPLEAVCSHETWEEIYERLTTLINENRTTLLFVNTRKMCERLAAHLSKRLGDDKVTSHHGSLSRTQRLQAEERLKSGSLKALVATSSLELGIDIGSIDLVCQIGVTNSINALLQRVGRSGHSLTGISKGKLFVLTLEELMTGAALLSAVKRGNLDILHIPEKPRDILAQQIVAACASEEWNEDELYETVRRAYNYRDLERKEFDEVLTMLAEGYSERRGRKSALIQYDAVGKRVIGRKGARLAAITSGGAIPDNADFQVVQEPQGIVVGSLNEDFAVESTPGDIFQLGNTSWRILKVEPGRVRVEDAHGQPPSIPFWLGEAPARTDELSEEVTYIRQGIEERLTSPLPSGVRADVRHDTGERGVRGDAPSTSEEWSAPTEWLMNATGMERGAAEQLVIYLGESKRMLGAVPTTQTLILERFFDESGGMQLVLHAPFGRRINWAWGLSLRKRFCRGFNFELQAAASENALLLSLGPQHSFPLADVFRYLNSNTVEELLVQAMLVAPLFQARWRWDAQRALALLRFTGGKKVPPALMRMRAGDLMAAVFPHAAACPENLEGDREIPNHPLVKEVLHDCLTEAMDLEGLKKVLDRIHAGELNLIARDTTTPSPLAGEILTAKPYAFLDDAPLEERRTQAVFMRRGLSREDAASLGALDQGAIDRVREEAWPDATTADELHDALMLTSYLTLNESEQFAAPLKELIAAGRATRIRSTRDDAQTLVVATERVPMFEAAFGGGQTGMSAPQLYLDPPVQVPEKERAKSWTNLDALREIVCGRLEVSGPITVSKIAAETSLTEGEVQQGMIALESQGFALRGVFTPHANANKLEEWCDRRLLSRIHRYTLDRLRSEIQPVTAAEYMRFLFEWQHVSAPLEGPQSVREIVAQLQGVDIPAVAWERDILPLRVKNYDRRWLDHLCLSGELTWGRRFPPSAAPEKKGLRMAPNVRVAPISLLLRDEADAWLALSPPPAVEIDRLSGAARQVLESLQRRGAMFFQNLVKETRRLPTEVETALGELVAAGLVSGDGFGGLRALLMKTKQRRDIQRRRRIYDARKNARLMAIIGQSSQMSASLETAGRWSLFHADAGDLFAKPSEEQLAETVARQLLRRWGVVLHRVIARENGLPPWRDILRVLRRMEARGELRGGRFVEGFSGEQYALPEAVERLRALRKTPLSGKLVTICGADPLNLAGIILPGERVAARTKSRIVFRDGVPVAIKESGQVRLLERDTPTAATREIYAALMRKAM